MFTTLLAFRLRRDRTQLIVWWLALGILLLFSVSAMAKAFPTAAERVSAIHVMMQTKELLLVRGTPQGSSAADMTVLSILTFFLLLVGLMNTFLAVRGTRAEEDTGIADLVSSTPAGRTKPLAVVIVEGVGANIVLAIVTALALIATGLPALGSVVFAVATLPTGLTFLGVGLLCATVLPTGRSANAWAGTIVVLAYFVRGMGDATGTVNPDGVSMTAGGISWISPIGWAQRTAPYAQNTLWPTLLGLAVFVILLAAVFLLEARRDLGLSLVPERAGRGSAGSGLRGPIGLAWRLQRGSLLGWGVGLVAMAALAGELGGQALKGLASNAGASQIISELAPSGGSVLQSFITAMAGFVGLLGVGAAVQGVMRARQEEASSHADSVLSAPVGRTRWLLSNVLVTCVGTAIMLVLGALAAAAAGVASQPDGPNGQFSWWFGSIIAEYPAIIFHIGVLVCVFALLPRATIAVGWAVFGLGAFLGEFGRMLGLPDWVQHIVPLSLSPALAQPNPSWVGASWLLVITAATAIIGVLMFRRRDTLPTG